MRCSNFRFFHFCIC